MLVFFGVQQGGGRGYLRLLMKGVIWREGITNLAGWCLNHGGMNLLEPLQYEKKTDV